MSPLQAKMKKARKAYGLSSTMMSRFLGLGINQWSLYEKGVKIPSESNYILIYFACTPLGMKKLLILASHMEKVYSKQWHKAFNVIIEIEKELEEAKAEMNRNYFN